MRVHGELGYAWRRRTDLLVFWAICRMHVQRREKEETWGNELSKISKQKVPEVPSGASSGPELRSLTNQRQSKALMTSRSFFPRNI